MSSKKEVVILGAGVIGCSIAYHLAKRGVPSQVIERDSIANRASGKAWAIIPHPMDTLQFEYLPPEDLFSMPKGSLMNIIELFWHGYLRINDVALEIREKGGIDIGLEKLGMIYTALSRDDEKAVKDMMAIHKNLGYTESYWIDQEELRGIYPDISPQARGGVVVPIWHVEPYRYTLGLAQTAERMGVNLRQGEAVGFKRKGTKVKSVTLATGTEVQADVFVLAMGPWNVFATKWLGKEISVTVNQEECLKVQPAEKFPPFALMGPAGQIVIPQADGSVILGHSGVPDGRPDYNNQLKESNKVHLIEEAVKILPSLTDAKLIEHRGDLMNWSPTAYHWQPALGLVPGFDNAYVAMRVPFGMMLSLGIGKCLANLIIADGKAPFGFKNLLDVCDPAKL